MNNETGTLAIAALAIAFVVVTAYGVTYKVINRKEQQLKESVRTCKEVAQETCKGLNWEQASWCVDHEALQCVYKELMQND